MSTRVKDVYENRSVFITGATGFLGKVIVEKLLWCNPNIGNLFLLIRPSRGLSPHERLEKILKDPLFDRLRTNCPERFSKLVPVQGDIMETGLGINQHDMQTICDEVSIVIHSAATVKFDEQLRAAVTMNVGGTTRIIALCHKLKNLISVVHVSTAYANCDREETEEKIYEPPVNPTQLMEALNWMDDEMIDKITPKLLGNRPNTYTLTKALAESQLQEDAGTLPVIVIRPSIVGAMWNSPLPGWTDNVNGPTGIFAAVGKGVLTNMCGSTKSKADIIPVDIVANMIIVAAAHRAVTRYDTIPIMHCASGDLNPIYWSKIVPFLEQFYNQYPMDECYGVPTTYFHSNRKIFLLNYYYKHQIPAYLMDLMCRFLGKKQINVRLYGKVWKMIETLHYFTTHGWTFHSKGLPALWDTLNREDQQTYNFDVRQVNWDSYLFDYVMGIKRYILKEKIENIPTARWNLFRLRFFKLAVQAGFWLLLVRIFGNNLKKKQRYLSWFAGLSATHIFTNYGIRPKLPLKSLEDYQKLFKKQ